MNRPSLVALAVSFSVGLAALQYNAGSGLRDGLVAMAAGLNTVAAFNEARKPADRWKRRTARRITNLAARLSGNHRDLHAAWLDVLAGDPEAGYAVSAREQRRLARGFLVAALRMRAHDLAAPLWHPLDWLLAVKSRGDTFVALAVGAQAIYIAAHDGVHGLLTEGWAWCAGCGIALTALLRWLRRARGIELAAVEPGE